MAVEELYQTEEQPPKLKVKDFAAKIKAKYPEYKDVDDTELTKKIIDKYPEYKEQVDFEEKKNGGSVAVNPSENGLSGTQNRDEIPTVSLEDNETISPIDLVKQHNELANATTEVGMGSAGLTMGFDTQTIPDENKIKKANDLKEFLKINRGIDDPERLYEETKDLTDTDFGKEGFDKNTLLGDRSENNPLYYRKINRLKWKSGLENEVAKILDGSEQKKEEYNNIMNIVNSSLDNANVGTYDQQRKNINSVANIIKVYGGENKNKLLTQYAAEVSKIYGNAYKNGGVIDKEGSPESKYFTDLNEKLGYQYLKDISPEQAQQYELLFVDPKTLKGNPDALRGFNQLKQRLTEIGINLQQNAVDEDYNNLTRIAKANGGLNDEQLKLAEDLQKKNDELAAARKELDNKYPDRIENKIDDAVQEVLGQRANFLGRFAGKVTQGVGHTVEGTWDFVSHPFKSDASNNLTELGIMGRDVREENQTHLTDKNKAIQDSELIFDPELKKTVDAIVNDKTLSQDSKEFSLRSLLNVHRNEFGRVPILGGKFNPSPSAILNAVSDVTSSLVPFVAVEAATGGIGGASTAAKIFRTANAAFTTGFYDHMAEGIKEGKHGSELYKFGVVSTLIDAMAIGGAQTASEVRALAGNKTSAAKMLATLSDKEIDEQLSKGVSKSLKVFGKDIKPFLQQAKDRLTETPKMFGEGLKTGAKFEAAMTAANELKHQIYNTPIDREMNLKHSILGGATFGIIGAGLGHIGYKAPNELQRDFLVKFGENPESFHAMNDQMKKDGEINQTEYEHRKLLIDNAEAAYKTLPKANGKGQPLTEKEKGEYLYNSVIKNEGKKAASNLPPKQAEQAEHTSMVADYKNQMLIDKPTDKQLESRQSALEKKLEPVAKDETPLTDNIRKKYEAELDAIKETIEERKKYQPKEKSLVEVQPPMNIPEIKEIKVTDEPIKTTPESTEYKPTEEASKPKEQPTETISEAGTGEKEPPPVESPKEEIKSFDEMAVSIPNGGEIKKYLSGDTIKKYEGGELRNNQEITAQELEPALRHGVGIIEKAKEIWGDKYVENTLNYIENEKLAPENKALIYVSLENELAKRRLEDTESVDLKKMQDLVRAKSQTFLRSNSLAINMGRLRKFAETGYDISKVTDKFFSSKELESKGEIEKLVQADADAINKEAESVEQMKSTEFTPEQQQAIQEGVEKEVNKIYDALPKEKKRLADRAIDALEKFQKSYKGRAYESTGAIPLAIIDAGVTATKLAIKAGVKIADAIELGIKKIKEKWGKEWANEDKFRKDMLSALKEIEEEKIKTISAKERVKQALILRGYGRKIKIKGEEKEILDWKKLAGIESSISKLRETVNSVLEEKGWAGLSDKEKGMIKADFLQEYTDLRYSVIEKGLNEIARRNKTSVTPEQKSAAKKLVEMYNYGLFDKEPIEYEKTLAKTIGIEKLNEKRYIQVKDLGEALQKIYSTKVNGRKLNETELRSAIASVEEKMRGVLIEESHQHGSTFLKIADYARTFMDTVQRMTLNHLKQAVENPLSGKQQSLISNLDAVLNPKIGSTPELRQKWRRNAQSVYKDMVLSGGEHYGDVNTVFVNKGNLEHYINKMSDNQLYHAITSTAIGKTSLDAVDSMFKTKLTEQKFTHNLIRVLTRDRLVDGKLQKGMNKEDAIKYASEHLTGQSFKDAQETAKKIIDNVNKGGKNILRDSPQYINRLANDIVKSSLVTGGKITEDQVTAAYNAAYKGAGRNLGHIANNPISRGIQSLSGKIEKEIDDAIKEKEYNKAATLTLSSIFFRNVMNPFVAGGTNWVVLKLEKNGLGLITGLGSRIGNKKIDPTSEVGMKYLEKALYQENKSRDAIMRGAIGGATAVLTAMLWNGVANTDEYRKWRGKNMWAARYLDLVTPEEVLAAMYEKDERLGKYVENLLNKNDQYDKVKPFIKAANLISKDKTDEAKGALGEGIGNTFGTPIPWRLVRDGQNIWLGASGQEPIKVNNEKSKSFLNGLFKAGFVEYIGARPDNSKNKGVNFERPQIERPKRETTERPKREAVPR